MSPDPAGGPPLTVSGVLRAALSLVRRRWFLFAVLAVVLAILPDVLADAAADLEHRPLGPVRSERENDAQVFELESFLVGQAIPPDRKAL